MMLLLLMALEILNSYFNNSEIVILGGSFVNIGGHNPLEPALHGCALLVVVIYIIGKIYKKC